MDMDQEEPTTSNPDSLTLSVHSTHSTGSEEMEGCERADVTMEMAPMSVTASVTVNGETQMIETPGVLVQHHHQHEPLDHDHDIEQVDPHDLHLHHHSPHDLQHHHHHHHSPEHEDHHQQQQLHHQQTSLVVNTVGTVAGQIPGLNGAIVTTASGQMMTTTTESITATTENGVQQIIPEGTVVLMSIVPKREMDDCDTDGDALLPRKQLATVVQTNGDGTQGVTFLIHQATAEDEEQNGEIDGDDVIPNFTFII
jgi:hypothetical protein